MACQIKQWKLRRIFIFFHSFSPLLSFVCLQHISRKMPLIRDSMWQLLEAVGGYIRNTKVYGHRQRNTLYITTNVKWFTSLCTQSSPIANKQLSHGNTEYIKCIRLNFQKISYNIKYVFHIRLTWPVLLDGMVEGTFVVMRLQWYAQLTNPDRHILCPSPFY